MLDWFAFHAQGVDSVADFDGMQRIVTDEPLESAFVPEGTYYIVHAAEQEYGIKASFGPFYNQDVAHAWMTDCGLYGRVIRLVHPPKTKLVECSIDHETECCREHKTHAKPPNPHRGCLLR